jgi:hypothetical protein
MPWIRCARCWRVIGPTWRPAERRAGAAGTISAIPTVITTGDAARSTAPPVRQRLSSMTRLTAQAEVPAPKLVRWHNPGIELNWPRASSKAS